MERIVLPGSPPVEIALRRSARARRLSLRISSLDGRVTLSVPTRLDPAAAVDFARDKEDWIRRHLTRHDPPEVPAPGGTLLFRGRKVALTQGAVRTVTEADDALVLPEGRGAQAGPLLRAFLKTHARTALVAASDLHAARLGRRFGRITLRDTRSRWGSCTAEGNLMYSWRLIMAPPEVLDYVAAHEVAHLVEMNHSRAFWRVVEQLVPRHEPHRAWLRSHGARLHAVRFGD